MEQVLASEVRDVIPPCAFFHTSYYYFDQYPQGLADVVGYWAEGQIFGGVVVFDRRETESEVCCSYKKQRHESHYSQCKSMWIHGARLRGPRTLYPPTPDQFDSLINFLLSDPKEGATCPLPIHGTNENRPRWHPYDALAKYHIFRDKYIVRNTEYIRREGGIVTDEEIAAASARLKEVTPSSPCWHPSLEKHK